MKLFKKLLGLGIVLSSISPTIVYGYSNEDGTLQNTKKIEWNEFDPHSWNQTNAKDMPLSWLGNTMLDGSSGVSFPEGADLLYVYTFLALKTGYKMPGYIPSFANADLEYLKAYSNGLPHFGAEGIWGDGWSARLTEDGSQYLKGTLAEAKKEWLSGNLVVLQLKYPNYSDEKPYTHFAAIDSIEDNGEIYIFDSVNVGLRFTDSYRPSDVVGYIILENDKVKSYDLPVLWKNRSDTDLFSSEERDPSTLGGGGGRLSKETKRLVEEQKKEQAESAVVEEDENSLGDYVPVDDAPIKEKGSRVEEVTKTKKTGSKFYYLLTGIGILLIGGILAVWKYVKRRS